MQLNGWSAGLWDIILASGTLVPKQIMKWYACCTLRLIKLTRRGHGMSCVVYSPVSSALSTIMLYCPKPNLSHLPGFQLSFTFPLVSFFLRHKRMVQLSWMNFFFFFMNESLAHYISLSLSMTLHADTCVNGAEERLTDSPPRLPPPPSPIHRRPITGGQGDSCCTHTVPLIHWSRANTVDGSLLTSDPPQTCC